MATPKRLLHDKWVILLMLITALLMLFCVLFVLLRVETTQQVAILRYKTNLGPAGFDRGPASKLYAHMYLALISGVGSIVLARRVYKLRRSLSILLLMLANIVLLFNLVVANALLNLQ